MTTTSPPPAPGGYRGPTTAAGAPPMPPSGSTSCCATRPDGCASCCPAAPTRRCRSTGTGSPTASPNCAPPTWRSTTTRPPGCSPVSVRTSTRTRCTGSPSTTTAGRPGCGWSAATSPNTRCRTPGKDRANRPASSPTSTTTSGPRCWTRNPGRCGSCCCTPRCPNPCPPGSRRHSRDRAPRGHYGGCRARTPSSHRFPRPPTATGTRRSSGGSCAPGWPRHPGSGPGRTVGRRRGCAPPDGRSRRWRTCASSVTGTRPRSWPWRNSW